MQNKTINKQIQTLIICIYIYKTEQLTNSTQTNNMYIHIQNKTINKQYTNRHYVYTNTKQNN